MSASIPDGAGAQGALARKVMDHPAWGGFWRQAPVDYTLPDLQACRAYSTGAEDVAALARLGIHVEGGSGPGNLILLAGGEGGHNLRIRLGTRSGCMAVLGAECRLFGAIGFEGDGHLLVFNGRGPCHASFTFRSREGACFFGRNGTANQSDYLIEGPHRSIIIGDDVMLAYRVQIRTSDSHGIVSLDDPSAALNPPASVLVEPHVWIAKDAVIGRGCRIGRGAIIAMNTIVTGDVAPCTLVGGVPMRVLKERVTWTRASQPAGPEIRAAIAFAQGDARAGG